MGAARCSATVTRVTYFPWNLRQVVSTCYVALYIAISMYVYALHTSIGQF